jgi:hypothetical protein
MKTEIENYRAAIEKAYLEDSFWGKAKDQSFIVEYGTKFAKISHISWGSKSVHCFVEIENGNIWKAATFKAPQKNGIRGNLKDAKRPIFSSDFYKAR